MRERRRRVARERGRRRRFGVLGVLGLAAAGAVLWWVLTGPLLAVSDVGVTGYDRPDRDELAAAVEAAAAGGTVVSPPVEDMRAAARRFPWVDDIAVSRELPRGLEVSVTEARPAAVAEGPDGAVLVTAAGRVLGPAPEDAAEGRLVLDEGPPDPGRDLPDAAMAPLRFIAAAPDEVAARVSGLRAERGALVGRLADGPELRLGDGRRLPAKGRSLSLVLDHLAAEDEASAEYIDVSVPERPALGGGETSTGG